MEIKLIKTSSVFQDEDRRSGIGDATSYFIHKKDVEFLKTNTITFIEFLIKTKLMGDYYYDPTYSPLAMKVYRFVCKLYKIFYKGEEVRFVSDFASNECLKDYININKIQNPYGRHLLKHQITKTYSIKEIVKRVKRI